MRGQHPRRARGGVQALARGVEGLGHGNGRAQGRGRGLGKVGWKQNQLQVVEVHVRFIVYPRLPLRVPVLPVEARGMTPYLGSARPATIRFVSPKLMGHSGPKARRSEEHTSEL